jgi:hypothetical protein
MLWGFCLVDNLHGDIIQTKTFRFLLFLFQLSSSHTFSVVSRDGGHAFTELIPHQFQDDESPFTLPIKISFMVFKM